MAVKGHPQQAVAIMLFCPGQAHDVLFDLLYRVVCVAVVQIGPQGTRRFILDDKPVIDRVGAAGGQGVLLSNQQLYPQLSGQALDFVVDRSLELGFIMSLSGCPPDELLKIGG
ncbi:hypothetical protein [Rhodothermus marinus]|uniref:hypothetical protein n=1 Tax=Rhodothermus marinus TaxID=29549 RepID=UPI001FB1EB16|nr:hypothetical protein [Rhodothermus marinus]